MLNELANNVRLERWKETPLRKLLETHWDESHFQPVQSLPTEFTLPEKAVVIPLVNGVINTQWFDDLHLPTGVLAHADHGKLSIKIVEASEIEQPIVIHHHTTTDSTPRLVPSEISIEVEAKATVSMMLIESGKGEYLSTPRIQLQVKPFAKCEWVKVALHDEIGTSLSEFYAEQEHNSDLSVIHYQSKGKLVRSDLHVALVGEAAHTAFMGLNIGKSQQHLANVMTLDHKVPNCTSMQTIKNLLTDRAMALFDGMIHVFQDAQKTDADQITRSILLSDHARAMTIPRLEIYADDVRCTHGATIGFIEPESLFYLQSRGIDQKSARNMLMRAYALDVIEGVNHSSLRTWLLQRLDDDLIALNA